MLEFFRDPTAYDWVKLECDDPRFAAIDDVIARRKSDGKYDVTQVKFTVDPDRGDLSLSWEWLLHKKGSGTSLLEKWTKGVTALLRNKELHSARLATNRIPNPDFSACLENSFVDLSRVKSPLKEQIVDQFGSEASAHCFFSNFRFDHSQPLINDLEIKLRNRVVPADTDESGWCLFLDRVKIWATRLNEPEADGCIRHKHLVQVLSLKRPKPISQNFKVPDGYIVPDENFDNLIKRRIISAIPATVIWGSPGRGKSTYLSNLVRWLSSQDIPYIRHHYFIDLADSTDDRISFTSAAGSLMDQMRLRYRDAVGGLSDNLYSLSDWITACGDHFKEMGKPFVVIVDGLDHVWREGRQMEQMYHLFNRILPASPNVCCIFGTQNISDEHLPPRLLVECPKDKWIELPLLSDEAIAQWLKWQINNGRMDFPAETPERVFDEIVEAVSDITNGHPLHLIYSIEQLIRNGKQLCLEEINALPPCPDGDIKKYYQLLWSRLTPESKAALHLMAGLRFNWPSLNSLQAVSAKLSGPSLLSDIDHLIERRQIAITPFHGSILAWVRERNDHDAIMAGHYPNVVDWLENSAPPYWRWAWFWITKSDAGQSDDLLNNPCRAWVTESICRGYQPDQIEYVLSLAARLAFDQKHFARCLELKSLATRAINGPEFQTHDFSLLQEVALSLTEDTYPVEWMADNLPLLSESELLLLARHPISKIQQELINLIRDELTSRQKHLVERGFQRVDEFTILVRAALRVSSLSGNLDPHRAIKVISQFSDGRSLFEECLGGLLEGNQLLALVAIIKLARNAEFADTHICASAIVRLLCSEGAAIAKADVFSQLESNGLFQCWCHLSACMEVSTSTPAPNISDAIPDSDGYGISLKLETFFQECFFAGLSAALQEKLNITNFIKWSVISEQDWLKSAISQLLHSAELLATRIKQNKYVPAYGYIFESLKKVPSIDAGPNDKERRQYISFKSALIYIARDVHFLGMVSGGPSEVTLEQYEIAASSEHWVEDLWLERYLYENVMYFGSSAVKYIIQKQACHLNKHVTQFDERTLLHSQLACIAIRTSLETDARQMLMRAASCLVGYGYRKDYWLWDVITSIHCCALYSSRNTRDFVRRIAPIVDAVDDYTDGDEIPHAKGMLTDLVADAAPEMLSSRYSYFLDKEEWSEANSLFDSLLGKIDLKNPVWAAVASTAIDQTGPWTLQNRAGQGVEAQGVANRIKHIIGTVPEPPRDRSTSTDDESLDDLPDFSDFPPEKLADFVDVLNSKRIIMKKQETLLSWATYWRERGKANSIKAEVDRLLKSEKRTREVEELVDFVFEISLKLEGKSQAFPWLVRAHRYRNGWSRWTSREEQRKRLDRAAELYPSEWNRFLIETSAPTRHYETLTGAGPVMGTDDLVYYLLKCGQTDLAFEITCMMIEVTIDEFDDQPIGNSTWLH